MDADGWHSVTPEPIANHIATRVKELSPYEELTVLDSFVGLGSNLIPFALKCGYCIGVDVDQTKLDYCQTNSEIYGLKSPANY